MPKASMPLEPAVADVKVWLYNVTGNGRGMTTLPSSLLMPVLVVPGTKVPVPMVYAYTGVQAGVGVGEGATVAVAVAVAVGVPVGVGVGVGVGQPSRL